MNIFVDLEDDYNIIGQTSFRNQAKMNENNMKKKYKIKKSSIKSMFHNKLKQDENLVKYLNTKHINTNSLTSSENQKIQHSQNLTSQTDFEPIQKSYIGHRVQHIHLPKIKDQNYTARFLSKRLSCISTGSSPDENNIGPDAERNIPSSFDNAGIEKVPKSFFNDPSKMSGTHEELHSFKNQRKSLNETIMKIKFVASKKPERDNSRDTMGQIKGYSSVIPPKKSYPQRSNPMDYLKKSRQRFPQIVNMKMSPSEGCQTESAMLHLRKSSNTVALKPKNIGYFHAAKVSLDGNRNFQRKRNYSRKTDNSVMSTKTVIRKIHEDTNKMKLTNSLSDHNLKAREKNTANNSDKMLGFLDFKDSKKKGISIKHGGFSRAGLNLYNSEKPNQDRFISSINLLLSQKKGFNIHLNEAPKYSSNNKIDIFGVFDGHGVNGHLVSEYVKEKLPNLIRKNLINSKNPIDQVITDCVEKIDNNLLKSQIESNYSGTTCVFGIIKDCTEGDEVCKKLFLANTGDSRALFCNFQKVNILKENSEISKSTECSKRRDGISKILSGRKSVKIHIETTVDHNCENQKESDRIINSGGVVRQAYNQGPLRVWNEGQNEPGVAMTRSIGDHIGKGDNGCGLTSTPDILTFDIPDSRSTLILASDGIYDVFTNDSLADYVWKLRAKPAESVAKIIVNEAYERWKTKDSNIDDCTCVVVYLTPQE
ncbi:unnamed protein product [Moneuplotes crassus]|uniref:PPM-type phosphatase domain-containing protein n=1 Tax=Euplotes crassus TaxID=5936 RepID=A0AAD1Y0L3_EUPCR|nr:unnamed protein product [Moneuplotes crassus]